MTELPTLNFVGHLKIALMGTTEISKLIGVSRQRTDQLSREKGFPEPVCMLSCGRIWYEPEVRAWAIKQGRLQ